MPDRETDWQAEADLDALIRAEDIKLSRQRVNQAREMASRRAGQYGDMASRLKPGNLGMNNAVRNSKWFGEKK